VTPNPLPGNKKTDAGGLAQAPASALLRHEQSLTCFDARWLWCVVVITPLVLWAGVYWLHRLPAGSQVRSGSPTVEVRLIESAAPDPLPLVRPSDSVSDGRREPLINAPNRPIPEETTTAAHAPAPASPGSDLDRASSAYTHKPRPAAGGSKTTFQRALQRHIGRFRRYPSSAQSGQRGIVHVVFSMRRDGTVSEIAVRRSSGHPALDEAATDTIRRAQPLPTIPPDLPDILTISLPVSFDP
jgi:protein TonB